jgi:hypothetical protein
MTSNKLPKITRRFAPALIVAALVVVAVFGASAANFSFFGNAGINGVAAPKSANLPGRSAPASRYAALMNSVNSLSLAANPTAKDWQAENGGFGEPVIDPVDWVSGSVNGTKAHYVEGQSIPYAVCLTNLEAGIPATMSFKYDTLKGGKHAIDFITSNNRIA